MAYQKYITEALVCGSKTRNSADMSYLLFTREAGMLYAHARSVRHERSRNRYALQEFSVVLVSLVHAKAGWQITSAESIENNYFGLTDRVSRTYVRNLVQLLRRYVHGEESHPDLYDEIITAIRNADQQSLLELEAVIRLRAFHKLGYISPTAALRPIIDSTEPQKLVNTLTKEDFRNIEAALSQVDAVSHL